MFDLASFDQASVNFLIRTYLATMPDQGSAGSGVGHDLDALDFLESAIAASVHEVGGDQTVIA